MIKEPLYFDTKDFQNDMGVRQLSASATGVYFWILCILHESETRGRFCLSKFASKIQAKDQAKPEAKVKQTSGICLDVCLRFASVLSKLMPFTSEEIAAALDELLYFKIIHISGDILEQKRMVRDAEIRNKRASAGKKGGNVSKGNAAKEEILLEQNSKQNSKQNSSKSVSKEPSKTPSKNEEFASDLLPCECAPAKCVYNNIQENITQEEDTETKGKGVQGGNHQKADGSTIPMSEVMSFVALWEQKCPDLPSVRKLTDKRRDKIRARLRDEPDMTVWAQVFEKISASAFCNGTASGGWRASLDWITANSENYVKVLEGNYDRTSRQPAGGAPGSSSPGAAIDWSAEERL